MQHDLTDRYLKSLKAPSVGRLEVSDTKRAGLRLRLYATGKAIWMYEKRVKGGQKRKHTLGAWPEPVSLTRARALALELEAEAAQGIDRVALNVAEQLEREAAQSSALSVRQVLKLSFLVEFDSHPVGDEPINHLRINNFKSIDANEWRVGELRTF